MDVTVTDLYSACKEADKIMTAIKAELVHYSPYYYDKYKDLAYMKFQNNSVCFSNKDNCYHYYSGKVVAKFRRAKSGEKPTFTTKAGTPIKLWVKKVKVGDEAYDETDSIFLIYSRYNWVCKELPSSALDNYKDAMSLAGGIPALRY